MADSNSDLEKTLRNILGKVGRNLYQYQLLEKVLENHLKAADISVNMEDGVKPIYGDTDEKKPKPMGSLTNDHTKTIFGSGKKKRIANDSNSFTFSFRIEDETGELSKWRNKRLRQLTEERNRLAHKLIDRFDTQSIESCQRLSVELDAEYKRIVDELEYLNRLSRKFKGMHNKLAGYLNSEEGKNFLARRTESN